MEKQTSCVMWALDPPDASQAQAIAQFMRAQQNSSQNYPLEKDALLKWKLIDNIAHPGFASMMVTQERGEIVSLCTITPKRLWLGGREWQWGEIGDTFTDRQHLRQGMFASLVNANRQRAQLAGHKIIYGLPNEQSAPGYLKKLGFVIKANVELLNYTLALQTLDSSLY